MVAHSTILIVGQLGVMAFMLLTIRVLNNTILRLKRENKMLRNAYYNK